MPTEAIVTRPATPGDVEGVVEVMWQVAAEGHWIGIEVPFDRGVRRDLMVEAVGRPDHRLAVATAGHRVVGYLSLRLASYGTADLSMALLDGWRGRGLGRRLLDDGIAWAREAGAQKVALEAWPHNLPALTLYRRAGFHLEGRKYAHYRRRNGERWDAVLMGLPLVPTPWPTRPVTDDDSWDVIALASACRAEASAPVGEAPPSLPAEAPPSLPASAPPSLLSPATSYRAAGGGMWVMDGPGGVVAAAGYSPGPAGEAEVNAWYVARAWRRRGIARQLVGLIEADARHRGAARVALWVDERLPAARPTSEALGYRRAPTPTAEAGSPEAGSPEPGSPEAGGPRPMARYTKALTGV